MTAKICFYNVGKVSSILWIWYLLTVDSEGDDGSPVGAGPNQTLLCVSR